MAARHPQLPLVVIGRDRLANLKEIVKSVSTHVTQEDYVQFIFRLGQATDVGVTENQQALKLTQDLWPKTRGDITYQHNLNLPIVPDAKGNMTPRQTLLIADHIELRPSVRFEQLVSMARAIENFWDMQVIINIVTKCSEATFEEFREQFSDDVQQRLCWVY